MHSLHLFIITHGEQRTTPLSDLTQHLWYEHTQLILTWNRNEFICINWLISDVWFLLRFSPAVIITALSLHQEWKCKGKRNEYESLMIRENTIVKLTDSLCHGQIQVNRGSEVRGQRWRVTQSVLRVTLDKTCALNTSAQCFLERSDEFYSYQTQTDRETDRRQRSETFPEEMI